MRIFNTVTVLLLLFYSSFAEKDHNTTMATVTITFHYTPQIKAKHPDMEQFASLLVTKVNNNYKNNEIPITLKLHCVQPVDWSETDEGWQEGAIGCMENGSACTLGGSYQLGYIINKFDGDRSKMTLSADIGMVLVSGIGPDDKVEAAGESLHGELPLEKGYTIGYVYDWAVDDYTLDHEIGHMFGADHDRNNAGENTKHPRAYGMLIQPPLAEGKGFRTIMSKRGTYGHDTRIPYYSSSTRNWTSPAGNTYQLGNDENDVRETLIKNRFTMSKVGKEDQKCPTPLSNKRGGSN